MCSKLTIALCMAIMGTATCHAGGADDVKSVQSNGQIDAGIARMLQALESAGEAAYYVEMERVGWETAIEARIGMVESVSFSMDMGGMTAPFYESWDETFFDVLEDHSLNLDRRKSVVSDVCYYLKFDRSLAPAVVQRAVRFLTAQMTILDSDSVGNILHTLASLKCDDAYRPLLAVFATMTPEDQISVARKFAWDPAAGENGLALARLLVRDQRTEVQTAGASAILHIAPQYHSAYPDAVDVLRGTDEGVFLDVAQQMDSDLVTGLLPAIRESLQTCDRARRAALLLLLATRAKTDAAVSDYAAKAAGEYSRSTAGAASLYLLKAGDLSMIEKASLYVADEPRDVWVIAQVPSELLGDDRVLKALKMLLGECSKDIRDAVMMSAIRSCLQLECSEAPDPSTVDSIVKVMAAKGPIDSLDRVIEMRDHGDLKARLRVWALGSTIEANVRGEFEVPGTLWQLIRLSPDFVAVTASQLRLSQSGVARARATLEEAERSYEQAVIDGARAERAPVLLRQLFERLSRRRGEESDRLREAARGNGDVQRVNTVLYHLGELELRSCSGADQLIAPLLGLLAIPFPEGQEFLRRQAIGDILVLLGDSGGFQGLAVLTKWNTPNSSRVRNIAAIAMAAAAAKGNPIPEDFFRTCLAVPSLRQEAVGMMRNQMWAQRQLTGISATVREDIAARRQVSWIGSMDTPGAGAILKEALSMNTGDSVFDQRLHIAAATGLASMGDVSGQEYLLTNLKNLSIEDIVSLPDCVFGIMVSPTNVRKFSIAVEDRTLDDYQREMLARRLIQTAQSYRAGR